jgi:hypothetical protein
MGFKNVGGLQQQRLALVERGRAPAREGCLGGGNRLVQLLRGTIWRSSERLPGGRIVILYSDPKSIFLSRGRVPIRVG